MYGPTEGLPPFYPGSLMIVWRWAMDYAQKLDEFARLVIVWPSGRVSYFGGRHWLFFLLRPGLRAKREREWATMMERLRAGSLA
jgi:hypothetical protein